MSQNFEEYRGDTVTLTLTFKDSNGAAQDITGWTVFFTLKINKQDTDDNAVIKKTITEHTNPEGGITTITLTASETVDLLGGYFYDIQYKTDEGVIKTVLEGESKFLEDVTRRTE